MIFSTFDHPNGVRMVRRKKSQRAQVAFGLHGQAGGGLLHNNGVASQPRIPGAGFCGT